MEARGTVILIRHADVNGVATASTPLNEAGRTRANVLRHVLASADVGRIVVSQTRRSRETAQPLATLLGIDADIIGGEDVATTIPLVVAAVGVLPASSVTLVVGHSHTLPNIIRGLGGPVIPAIDAAAFDNLFVQVGPRLIHLRYGA